MATANPLTLPSAPVPFGEAADIEVTFELAQGETYTVTLTDPAGAQAAEGSVTFDGEPTPTVTASPPVTGQWTLQTSGGTLTALATNNTFSLTE